MHSHTAALFPSLSHNVTIIGAKHMCEGFMHTKKNTAIPLLPRLPSVLLELTICGAQQYRDLMMILQCHKTLSMIST